MNLPKPRPLGLVKRESVHFDNEASDTVDVQLFSGKHEGSNNWGPTRGSLAFLGRSKTESDIKHEYRSMRDLQETLRQAALLNIVAAVNHDEDDSPTVAAVPARSSGGQQFVGIKGASILGHPVVRPNTKLSPFVSSVANGAIGVVSAGGICTNEGISINNFSHNLQSTTSSSAAITSNMTTASHNSTLSHLLGQRPRTISIPRPRTQTADQGAFMHNSLLDAKEQLANVTTFRAKSRKDKPDFPVSHHDSNEDGAPLAVDTSVSSSTQGFTNGALDSKSELVRNISCLRGTGFENSEEHGFNNINKQQHTDKDAVQHRIPDNMNNNTYTKQSHQENNVKDQQLTKDRQRAQNVHQMQAVKRYISTNKKKEMMKKLTDIAKCDVVDMAESISSTNVISAPPIIIMSHQKENVSLFASEGIDTRFNRTKSMTSLHGRGEEPAHSHSNTRIQSETLESMAHYREAKKKAVLNVEEDLIIESINCIEPSAGVDSLYRTHRDQKVVDSMDDHRAYFPLESRAADFLFSEGLIGRPAAAQSFTPDLLELRPINGMPNSNSNNNRVSLAERRRPTNLSRRVANQNIRDKLISPSPAVYEASFHRPKASMGQVTLVGKSMPHPSASAPRTPVPTASSPTKPVNKRSSLDNSSNNALQREEKDDINVNKPNASDNPNQLKGFTPKHWGSVGKQPSVNSPILRTEIVDHLQCVGLVNHRQAQTNLRKSLSKVNGANKSIDYTGPDFDFDDEEYFDDDDSSETPRYQKNSTKYRKSKLYNAFRASEENLSTLVDNSSCVSEVITGRTLMNPLAAAVLEETQTRPPSRDPVNNASKEPLYMGCSSRVSEKELRSQYHYVNDNEEEQAEDRTGQFKVMKAIDQDAYFDFQHKKYRKNNEMPLNTAPNIPRMHFLKIKY